ncbi:MAG: Rpn family recombination-promoting nuclease/putative transposase [Desulfitobacteriaceae bacterium]
MSGDHLKGSSDPLVKWFLLLMAAEDEQIAEELEVIAMTDSLINKAMNEWDRLSQDQDTRNIYRSRMMARMDQASAMKSAERKGEARGIEKSIEKGKTETARMALQAGVSLEMVVQITGLDQATILKLKEEINQG